MHFDRKFGRCGRRSAFPFLAHGQMALIHLPGSGGLGPDFTPCMCQERSEILCPRRLTCDLEVSTATGRNLPWVQLHWGGVSHCQSWRLKTPYGLTAGCAPWVSSGRSTFDRARRSCVRLTFELQRVVRRVQVGPASVGNTSPRGSKYPGPDLGSSRRHVTVRRGFVGITFHEVS